LSLFKLKVSKVWIEFV